MTRVIGLDPSLTGTGIAGHGWSLAVASTGNVVKDAYPARWWRINDLAARVVEQVGMPDLVVIEAPSFDSKSTSAHDRAGLWWKLYGRLTGAGIPVATVTPSQLKKYALGKGVGSKAQVIEQVTRRLGHIWTDLAGDDNQADAVVLCAMGLDAVGAPVVTLPAANRAALTAVDWPMGALEAVPA